MMPHYFNQIARKKTSGPSAAVIRYDENGGAPSVVAQGSGALAQRIIELAQEHNVHLEEDESLLANLLDIDLGDSIPPQLYSVIAEMLILIEEMEKNY
ncbi:EscU/YscU/HrcU family type III secretion system export apparatus switch protein [Jeotgalibacillus sp. ET6]|uniref:EscU/YscU/HrcU family type III secretion system export apparatus switch protein n=1 Tax=Jeotgalibacillus sp. ET6 TaxID=3037260 RepID=UPI002418811B|nr:EscU/YscU/HrcU family type III secretion system export apparatus switch protein [Jeotgalibacillus sp. ET6]MDG5471597.1 EscU/YscU/HrcU family type III secretion system export apparatus switch protein [Jeotgalibacillus sp. ET6]